MSRLSTYAEKLPDQVKQRYEDKTRLICTVKKKSCSAHQIWCATFAPSGTPYMALSNAKSLVCVLCQIGCVFTPTQCAFPLTSVCFPTPSSEFAH